MQNGQAADVSSYLQYLPAPFHADSCIGRFLMIVETIHAPIELMVDTLPEYFDPRLTPEEMLPWLASWLGLELDENWPIEKRRELTCWAAKLYRMRGTRFSLREHLRIYVGRPPLIVENFSGLRLGQDAALGVNSYMGEATANTIMVTVLADRPEELDEQVLRHIVETEKPAHAAYLLEVQPAR